jgi:glycosyltransferase involved in cell wall biosynthesis
MSAEIGRSRFTILLPITRPPVFLPYAVDSVLAQSHADFELFIVGDGAPAATISWAKSAEERDSRVRLFEFPKGARHGEANRHAALAEATGTFVAHIADDDLWFPDFLTEMALHLRAVDFGNLVQCYVDANGKISSEPGDLATPTTHARMLNGRWNFFGLTVAGYRMSTYRTLTEGWFPAPAEVFTDLNMWRKFLSDRRVTSATRFAIQSLTFPAPPRAKWSVERRAREIGVFAERIRNPDARRDIAAEGFRALTGTMRSEVIAEASAHIAALQRERNLLKSSLDLIESRQRRATGGLFPGTH